MASGSPLGARGSVSCNLSTGVAEISQTKELDKKARISTFVMKKILRWAVIANTASSQQKACVLPAKTKGRIVDSFLTIFAFADCFLLCRVQNEQICQVLRASTAAQTSAALKKCVSE